MKAKACNHSRMKNFHANKANRMAGAREQRATKEKYKLIMDMNAWERELNGRSESIDMCSFVIEFITHQTGQTGRRGAYRSSESLTASVELNATPE